jgi:hypothetical protein
MPQRFYGWSLHDTRLPHGSLKGFLYCRRVHVSHRTASDPGLIDESLVYRGPAKVERDMLFQNARLGPQKTSKRLHNPQPLRKRQRQENKTRNSVIPLLLLRPFIRVTASSLSYGLYRVSD